ncbi:helix-turn-helix domain-containing protein [Plantactinospora sp. CA-290183]|uniref:helix-turn-helix domain-containing protein n=1 Tax=Plantactinospora sp. CA-290183 TaxID=3240006 RepID=UPI003D929D73
MGRGPTVPRRRLGAELKSLREATGLAPEDAAKRADVSASAVWRLESAKVQKPRVPVVRSLLMAYKASPDLVEVLVQLARDAGQPGWWHQYGDVYPDWFEVYVGLEAEASSICLFELQLVPGILQTESYARATIRAEYSKATEEEIRRKVAFRMKRQALIEGADPPRIWAVVDEAALHREVGGREVLRGQLQHLVKLASHAAVTLQVLPFSAGAHPAMGQPFVILSFGDSSAEVVYLENYVSALYPERSDQIERYKVAFDHIRAAALAPGPSADLIARRMEELG